MIITPEKQIQRALRHAAEHFQHLADPVLTDIIVRVFPHSGEVKLYDDDERELMRIVIGEWIHGSRDKDFYTKVTPVLRKAISGVRAEVIDTMQILRPYTFVMQDEDGDTLTDLYIVDDQDTVILSGTTLLEGLDEELDAFLKKLMED